jgi:hypothetical protein
MRTIGSPLTEPVRVEGLTGLLKTILGYVFKGTFTDWSAGVTETTESGLLSSASAVSTGITRLVDKDPIMIKAKNILK